MPGRIPVASCQESQLFTTAVTQAYSDDVVEELKQKIEREGVTSRYENAHPISGLFTGVLLSFLDPVKLLLTAVFAGIAAIVGFRAGL